jgi:ketosteroid isomerase-like protein
MDAVNPVRIFERFIAAINHHDINSLTSLMTEDHLFVDSLANQVQGAKFMEGGWRGYFDMCPDYWIRIRKQLVEQDTVLATGEAGGTIDNTPWRTPVAIEAVIRTGAVSEWRVFADNKPVYEILAKRPW